jgi:Domain of unknown function (DUF1844)
MSEEDPKSFVIRDRRGRGEEETSTSSGPSTASASADSPAAASTGDRSLHEEGHEPHPPVTFAGFVFSLGSSAMMLMGEQLDPQQGRLPMNLPQAKEIIDLLSMLEAKTQGNLTTEEQSVLTDMLYALRMKYVDLASGKRSAS